MRALITASLTFAGVLTFIAVCLIVISVFDILGERSAKQLGFASRQELLEAEKKGFKEPIAYRDHLKKNAAAKIMSDLEKVERHRAKLAQENKEFWALVDKAIEQSSDKTLVAALGQAVSDFNILDNWAQLYLQAYSMATSGEESQKAMTLKKNIHAARSRALPKLRVAYIKAANAQAWIEDGKVKERGSTSIAIYHRDFFLNRNIQKIMDQLRNVLDNQYRFKQACFAPYEGASHTCYDLNPSADENF